MKQQYALPAGKIPDMRDDLNRNERVLLYYLQ